MRKLTLFLLAISVTSCATMGSKVPEEERHMQIVYNFPGNNADALFVSVNSWFVDTFNSAESVIEFSDKEAGIVKGKYAFMMKDGIYDIRVMTTITVNVKDEKCRISFDNPIYAITGNSFAKQGAGYQSGQKPVETEKMMNEVKFRWSSLANSLSTALKSQNDTW